MLLNWFDAERGYFILDALDAARSGATQALLRRTMAAIMRQQSRWTVIASVREFDLRHGQEWQQIFHGEAPQGLGSEEFRHVRHVYVRRLSDAELDRAAETLPGLAPLRAGAPSRLRELLRNIFNLHLMAELLGEAELADLQAVRYQVELLDRYWRQRLHREPERRDAREEALSAVLTCMVSNRTLRAERQEVRRILPSADLSELERIGVLRSPPIRRAQSGEVLILAHHILFDYAVARLTFRRGREPHVLVDTFQAEPDLALMLGPGVALCLDDAWLEQPPERPGFWQLAYALAVADDVPEITKLQAPMAVATNARSIDDLRPLIWLLDESADGPVDRFLWHLAAALLLRIETGTRIVGEHGGPWAAFADKLSVRVDMRSSIYALRNLVGMLTERPDELTAEQLEHAGRAARRLLEAAWARQYDRSLVVTCLNALCETYGSDRAASAALIRRALEPAHIRQHGFEEMPRLAHKIDRVIAEDPDLAVDIYRTAFAHDEDSTEQNPMGSSVLLGLISNRRQDYRHGWWALAEKFSAFLASHPVHAVHALIGALEGYAAREHGVNRDSGQAAVLDLSGATTHLREDASHIWAPRDHDPHDDAERMLAAFSKYLGSLADEDNGEDVFRELFETVAAENELAVIWAVLIHAAADTPRPFAVSLAGLVSATEILTWRDTHYAAARYLENAFPSLSEASRAAIEHAIVGLPQASESERRLRLRLAGYLPAASVVTEEARELYREAEDAKAARKSEPLFSIGSWAGSLPSLSEQLEESGVNTEAPSNRHLIHFIEPVRAFVLEHLDGQSDEAALRSAIPALRALHESILATDSAPEIVEEGLNHLAAAVARTARVEAIAKDDRLAEFLRSVLVLAAGGRNPEYSPEREAQFARSPSWGSPSARIEAAEGLMDFLCWRRQEFDSLRLVVDELARDPVASVRFQIAKRLLYFYQDQRDWVQEHIKYFLLKDVNASLVREALRAALRIRSSSLEETFELATAVFERFKHPSHEGEDRCRDDAATVIADLHVWHGHEDAGTWIESFLDAPGTPSSAIRDLIARYRDTIVHGPTDRPDDRAETARGRALRLYCRIVEGRSQAAERLWKTLQALPTEDRRVEDGRALREHFEILDQVAMQLYFRSGAYDARSNSGRRPGPVQRRLFTEVYDVLDALSNVPVPHTSHHLIETLEFLIDCSPAEVFRLIARAIRASEGQGYTADPMAVDLFARVIERYLAEFREVFDDKDRRMELLACLNAFVRHGSPKARQLTHRIPSIWE